MIYLDPPAVKPSPIYVVVEMIFSKPSTRSYVLHKFIFSPNKVMNEMCRSGSAWERWTVQTAWR